MFNERLSEDIILLRYQQGSFFYTLSSNPEAVMSLEDQSSDVNLEEFEKNQDAIMEAQRSGKFIYDLSGGAR